MQIRRDIIDASTKRHDDLRGILVARLKQKPTDIADGAKLLIRRKSTTDAGGVKASGLDLERVLGDNDLVDLNYLMRGVASGRPVCRIIFFGAGGRMRGFATGFMVSPTVVMTNQHVFGTPADTQDVAIEFDYQLDVDGNEMPTTRFALDPNRYFHASVALDFALAAVAPTPIRGTRPLAEFGFHRLLAMTGKANECEYVTIIQHPSGHLKQVAIRENKLLKIEQDHLIYFSDTAPGSSGSPIFNDSWQVIGIHHSGVPETNAAGEWLGPDGQPAPSNPTEAQVKWIANEGVRVSSIIKHLQSDPSVAHGPPLDEVLNPPNATESTKSTLGGLAPEAVVDIGSGEPPVAPPPPLPTRQSQGRPSGLGPRVVAWRTDCAGVVVDLAVPVYVSLAPCGEAAAAPFRLTLAPAASDADEIALDPEIGNRGGYDPNFLGIEVPQPTLEPGVEAAPVKGGGTELCYHHFSVVMNPDRRMLHFAASNFDSSAKRRGKLTRAELGADKWVLDNRIAREHQVTADEIYDGTDLDLGHIVRRDDNYWGETEKAAQFANWDTFHYTNCTPQHADFNRSSGDDGLWGKLENHLTKESKRTDNPRLCVFAGPVFGAKDRNYRGVPVPSQYWKVVVGRSSGKLFAMGFLLSQDSLVKSIETVIAAGAFSTYQVPISRIERLTAVRFAKVVKDADTMSKGVKPKEASIAAEGLFWGSAADVPLLPQDDDPDRMNALDEPRSTWRFEQNALGPLPATIGVPGPDATSTRWKLAVAPVLVNVARNEVALRTSISTPNAGPGVAFEMAKDSTSDEMASHDEFLARFKAIGSSNANESTSDESIPDDLARELEERISTILGTGIQPPSAAVEAARAHKDGAGVNANEGVFGGLPNLVLGPRGRPKDVSDYAALFRTLPLPGIGVNWQSDATFAWLRLAGPNAGVIRGVASLPPNFTVPDDAVRSATGDTTDSVEAAGKEGRLFLCDYAIVEKTLEPSRYKDTIPKSVSGPLAAFAVSRVGGRLKPVAIQCSQEPGSTTNPVLTPGDGKAWSLAKSVMHVADANHHELVSHLARTHLWVELIMLATRRNLAPNHPLNRLLVPHFEGTVFINNAARGSLIAKDGAIDRIFAGTIQSSQRLAAWGVASYDFTTNRIDTLLASAATEKIVDYPYRDDSRLLWAAVHAWVDAYVRHYYKTPQDLADDWELRAWNDALRLPPGQGGAPGFPAIGSINALVDALTQIIFVPSCQHAAVNFPQRTDMAYAPAFSGSGWRDRPADAQVTDKDRLDFLPPLELAREQADLLNLLGGVYHTHLGEYASNSIPYGPWFTDPKVTGTLLPAFRAALVTAEGQIAALNGDRSKRFRAYEHLLPSRVPMSINI